MAGDDNIGNWAALVFGALLFCGGSTKLWYYLTTGQARFGPFRSFPFNLAGIDAAAAWLFLVVVGSLLIANAARRLRKG